jgi:hypothetical protein
LLRVCVTEITNQPASPQQSLVNALKKQKERVSTQLKTEREKQQRQKATQTIQKNNAVLAKLNNY